MEGSFVDIVKMMAKGGHPYALAGSRATRRLELGCGLAGAALSELVAFPEIRQVVGVELSEDLAAEAELGSVGFVDIETVPTGPTELLVVAIRP